MRVFKRTAAVGGLFAGLFAVGAVVGCGGTSDEAGTNATPATGAGAGTTAAGAGSGSAGGAAGYQQPTQAQPQGGGKPSTATTN